MCAVALVDPAELAPPLAVSAVLVPVALAPPLAVLAVLAPPELGMVTGACEEESPAVAGLPVVAGLPALAGLPVEVGVLPGWLVAT